MVWGCFGVSIVDRLFHSLNVRSMLSSTWNVERTPATGVYDIGDSIGDPLFQKDDAPIRKAKMATESFESVNVDAMEHPRFSLDYNTIEHLWVQLKQRLYQKCLEFCKARGNPVTVKARLADVLFGIWEEIPTPKSMPDRVEAAIHAKGWYTRYQFLLCLALSVFFTALQYFRSNLFLIFIGST
jgi:hypothetical protein